MPLMTVLAELIGDESFDEETDDLDAIKGFLAGVIMASAIWSTLWLLLAFGQLV